MCTWDASSRTPTGSASFSSIYVSTFWSLWGANPPRRPVDRLVLSGACGTCGFESSNFILHALVGSDCITGARRCLLTYAGDVPHKHEKEPGREIRPRRTP